MLNRNNYHSPIKYCYECDCQLIPDDNWMKAQYSRNYYLCKSCHYKKNKDWRIANPEKAKAGYKEQAKKRRLMHPNEKRVIDKKYNQSEKGKIADLKHQSKRRGLGYTLLFNNPFPKNILVVGHHISDGFIVYLPKNLHQNHYGKNHRKDLKPFVESIYNFSYIIEEG